MNICACVCEHVQLVPSKVHFTWAYSVPAMFALNEAHERRTCVSVARWRRGCMHSKGSEHLSVNPVYLSPLQRFADVLTAQVGCPGSSVPSPGQVGLNLSPGVLDGLRDEQIGQLYKLKLETDNYGQSVQVTDKNE